MWSLLVLGQNQNPIINWRREAPSISYWVLWNITLGDRYKKGTCKASAFFIRLMESGRVELPSALAPNLPVIHRFIRFDPHGGNC